jgi:hypothetical protein
VATSDDIFDPNDLDSIDSLLDEAELEATVDDSTGELSEEMSVDTTTVEDEVPLETDLDDTDGLLDELGEVEGSMDDPAPSSAPKAASVSEPSEDARVDDVADKDDFLSKRAAAQTKQLPQMAAQDMDSIKKLIIIFSSTLIVLVLTGIGIGVWSALAASSAGVDDETITLIESIKVNSEQGAASMSENTNSVQLVEKKLDALNFQLEQLVMDLAIPSKVAAPKSEILDPLGLGRHGVIDNGQGAVTPATTVVSTQVDPAVLSKVTSVNAKMIKAQRRIDEVNSRVKSIQKQYQVLLKSVKMVEKQIVMEQLAKAEKAEKAKVAKDADPYQYTAPDGMFYDQSVQDSYP